MRILDRYIGREVVSYFLLGLLLFTFVFFIPQLLRLMELAIRHASDTGTVAMLFLCALPNVLSFTVPMAVLVGVLIGLGRLSADSEIIALHAVGVGLHRMLLPIGALALTAALLTLLVTHGAGPAGARRLRALEDRLRATGTSLQVQPRVFEERFGRLVLYVQDSEAAGTRWRGILLAEAGNGNGFRITLAEEAVVLVDAPASRFQIHLRNGSTHEYSPAKPDHYAVSTFAQSDLPMTVTAVAATRIRPPTNAERSSRELLAVGGPAQQEARIEYHRRWAFPAACLVFALLGVPVGVRPGRSSRAGGFVLTFLLVCGYYLLFVVGAGMARTGAVPPWLGIWLANVVTAAGGLALLPGMEAMGKESWAARLRKALGTWREKRRQRRGARTPTANRPTFSAPAVFGRVFGFPLLADLYLLRSFWKFFLLLAVAHILMLESFTFFELLGDIGRNRIPFTVVARFFFYLTPYLFYQLAPFLCLAAALVAVGILAKHNELVAFKASGVSVYRLSFPLLISGVLLAGLLFFIDSTILPESNRTQEALRNQIKGRPAQTFHQPRRQWIFGEGYRLYNYEFFDPDRSLFGGLNVFLLDPDRFQLRRRVYAQRAQWEAGLGAWVLQRGWVRDFTGSGVARYEPFLVTSLPELAEPPSYFLREVRQHHQMAAGELRRYIQDLQQAGFDVTRLSVQWHRKLSTPLMGLILILLGLPFALLVGTRGAVGGMALGVLISVAFWASSSLFEALGAVGQLPPLLAGWAPAVIFAFFGLNFYFKMQT